MQRESFFNSMPKVVILAVLVICGLELTLTLAEMGYVGGPKAIGWRNQMTQDFGLYRAIYDMIVERGNWSLDLIERFVAYAFIQPSFLSAVFAVVIIAALGKALGEVWREVSLAVVFLAATIIGGIVHVLIAPGNLALIGATNGYYGLIGAFTYVLWLKLSQSGGNRWRAYSLILLLLTYQVVWGLIQKILASFGMMDNSTLSIVFGLTSLSGFLTGLALSPLLGPGGWTHFVARIRQR